jgi:6-phosphofructokinase 1
VELGKLVHNVFQMKKTIGVLTSGGDSPGMNAAIRAVVRTSLSEGYIVYGIYDGFDGLMNETLEEFSGRNVSGIVQSGGTILRTARSKEFRTIEGRKKAFDTCQKYGINSLVVIGGDGSLHGLKAFIDEYGIQGIGIPGTIDNDLYGTDFTIGFDTAVNTALDAIDKIKDTAQSHSRVFLIEVMGRGAGYIALFTGIGSGAEEIFVPETEDDYEAVCRRLNANKAKGKRSNIIIVSEGDEAGGVFGVKQKIESILQNHDVRVSVLGHVQRGGRPTALDRVISSKMGYEAVCAIKNGETDKMVGIIGPNLGVLLTELKETWENHKNIEPSWFDMAKVLT